MNSPVQQIKERLSIVDIVSSYIKVDQAGSNYKAKCPFHNEKTASFFISPLRSSYYCFGCGASGDIFTFVEEFEGLDFKGALKLLAERAGITLDAYKGEGDLASGEKERLYKAMEESAKYFSQNLAENKVVSEYLKSRGLTEKSITDFSIGYAMADWRELHSYLSKKGFTDIEMEKAGLVKRADQDKGEARRPYDRFRGRVMFPISDSSGRVIAFSGRIFVDDEKSAKYLNSPDTPIFSKSAVLYGLDKAKESIRKNNFSILVEGQMDLVLSHQAGFRNTIATSGTALSDATVSKENAVSALGLIRRLSPNIVLAFDGDKAGLKASNRAGRIALALGMDVKVADLPEGVDPADLISKEEDGKGIEAWKKAIRDSKHIIGFILEKILKDFGNDERKVGKGVKELVLPFVDALDSSIDKAHFIKMISDKTSIPESALKDDLKKIEQELKYEKKEIEVAGDTISQVYRKDYILRKLLGIILWQKTLSNNAEVTIDSEATLKEIGDVLNISPEEVLEKGEKEKEDLIFEAEVFYVTDGDLKKDTEELLLNLKEEYLREELSKKMKELNLSEEKKDREKSAQILKEVQTLNDQIQNIKNSRLNLKK
ncbi:MAG: DNA primase [Candidatus Paceibacterota bacterium]